MIHLLAEHPTRDLKAMGFPPDWEEKPTWRDRAG
jgi:hypothetical protein